MKGLRLSLIITNDSGELHTGYAMADIKDIVTDKASKLYSKEDLYSNGVKPNDSMVVINFTDGSTASFHGSIKIHFYDCE